MAKGVVRIGDTFVKVEPIDEPECMRDMDDHASTFAQFLLPRVEKGTDEASKEVRAAMKAGRSLSDAIMDAVEALTDAQTRRLREWVDQARSSRIYAYCRMIPGAGRSRVPGGGGVDYGLRLTEGGPRDKVVAETVIDNYGPRQTMSGVLLEGEELRQDIEGLLLASYMTARDKAMLKGACTRLRARRAG